MKSLEFALFLLFSCLLTVALIAGFDTKDLPYRCYDTPERMVVFYEEHNEAPEIHIPPGELPCASICLNNTYRVDYKCRPIIPEEGCTVGEQVEPLGKFPSCCARYQICPNKTMDNDNCTCT